MMETSGKKAPDYLNDYSDMHIRPYIIIILLSALSGLLSNALQKPGIPLFYKPSVLENASRLTVAEAKFYYDRYEALFIDARSRSEFDMEHIPEAMNIPYDANRETRLALMQRVSRKRNIIIYCLDSTCNAAERVAGEMRFMGFERVALMPGGLESWDSAGFPLEVH